MKVRELIERLQQFDSETDVEVGTDDDSVEIRAVYHINLYEGPDKPTRQVICVDIAVPSDDDD